jgi:hypothetical protein
LFPLLATLCVAPPGIHPGAALAVFLLAPLLGVATLHAGWRPARRELWFLAALAFPLVLSHLNAVDAGGSVAGLLRLGVALLIFVAARELCREERRAILVFLVGAGAILALHGLWQFTFGFEGMLAGGGLDEAAAGRLRTYRVYGRFALPSVFGSVLILILPVAVALAMSTRGWRRSAAALAGAAMAGALILTQSHGALLALALTAGVWWSSGSRSRKRWLAIPAALAAAGLLLVSVARDGTVLSGATETGPVALRLRNFQAAAGMIGDFPLAGVGGGGFGSAYTLYRQLGDNETRQVHNTYLQMTAEHGLPMLLPLVIGLGCLALAIGRARQGRDRVLVGAAFGLTAFLLHNLWDFSGMLPATLWLAAAVAGLVAARRRDQPVTASPPGDEDPERSSGPAVAWVSMSIVLAVGALAGTLDSLSEMALTRARTALQEGDAPLALDEARRGERLAPWKAEHPMLQAELLLHHPGLARAPEETGAEALAAARRALALNRCWPAAHRTAALAALAVGDTGGAAVDLWKAGALYPLAVDYRTELEELAAAADQRREGFR